MIRPHSASRPSLPPPVRARGGEPAPYRAPRSILALLTIAFGVLFFGNEQDLKLATDVDEIRNLREHGHIKSVDDAEETIAAGNMVRRIAFPAIGMLGLGCIVFVPGRPHRVQTAIALAGVLYVAWCAATATWSVAPTLTIKRFIILAAVSVGVWGTSRVLSLRDLAVMTLILSTMCVALSVAVEVRAGVFKPWTGNFRFAGLVHPNSQSGYCSLMVCSALFLLGNGERHRRLLLALLIGGFAALVLTKSRTMLLATTLGCGAAVWVLANPRQRVTLLWAGPLALSVLMLGLMLSGVGSESLGQAATLGRAPEAEGFNGRLPLWEYLWGYIKLRPLQGYGYDTFFTPEQIYRASTRLEWTIPNAHNVAIEVLLGVGLVGLALYLAVAVPATIAVWRRLVREQDPLLGFVAALALTAMINSFAEASFSQPTGVESFITLAALAIAAIFPDPVVQHALADESLHPGWGRATYPRRRRQFSWG